MPGINYSQFFFRINNELNYSYSGSPPPFEDFLKFSDSTAQVENKKKFYDTLGPDWNFGKELLRAVDSEVRVLLVACCNFLGLTFNFQQKIKLLPLNVDKRGWIHPFEKKLTSISGFTYNLCSRFFLTNANIFGVNYQTTGKSTNSSKSEMEFCFYKTTFEPEKKWVHLYNNPEGQKAFGKYKVDLYSPVDQKVVEFYGCVTHLHLPPECLYKGNENMTLSSTNPFGVPLANLQIQDQARNQKLLTDYSSEVKEIEVQYECHWRAQRDSEIMQLLRIMNPQLKFRPLNRLNPRSTVRGGLTEIYCLRWQKEFHQDEIFYYSDVQGLYSFAAMDRPLPKGKYEIFISENFANEIVFHQDGFHYFKDKKLVCGAAQVTIKPPSHLKKPFLQFRVLDTFNFLSLCRLCILKKQKYCKHRDNRYFTSCWLFSDLRKAVSLGYVIDLWHEIYYFGESSDFLSTYSKLWYAEKIQNSGFPANVITEREKLSYCEEINQSLDLPEEFKIRPSSIEQNPAKRQLAKSCLNNLYGKFSQQSPTIKREFVTSQDRLEEILSNYKVLNITNLSEYTLHIEYETIASTQVSKSNLFVGAQINAYGREIIYDHMMAIERAGGKVFSVDVDGLFYSLPKNAPHPLKFSNKCGDFKNMLNEGEEILAFYALGVKNYCIVYQTPDGQIKSTIKVKGLCLTSFCTKDKLTPSHYQEFISSHFENNLKQILIPQSKFCIDPATQKSVRKFQNFTFANELYLKRFIPENEKNVQPSSIIETLPFGFKKKSKARPSLPRSEIA